MFPGLMHSSIWGVDPMQSAYRSILAFFLSPLLMSSLFAVDLVPWHTDLEQAIRTAKQENKPLLLHFWRTNCTACQHLESTVFNRQDVASFMGSNYVPVKVNSTQVPAIAAKYRVSRFPTDVILTPNQEEIHRMMTVPNSQQYISQLSAVAFRSGIVPKQAPQSATGRSFSHRSGSDALRGNQHVGNYASDRPSDYDRERPKQYADETISQQRPANAPSNRREVMNPFANGARQANYTPENDRQMQYIENATISEKRGDQAGMTNYPRQQRRNDVGQNRAVATPPQRRPGRMEHPPIALDGYCPVSLLQQEVWKKGDPNWGVVHRGRTYLFSSEQHKELFFARPDHFSPVLAGIDPVELADQGRTIEGKRAHGVVYKKRVYLFANEENLERFWKTPDVFADQILQAMGTGGRRYR